MAKTPQEAALFPLSENIDVLNRLDILHRDEGFLATSRGELNKAFNVRSFIETPGGAATHLAEIARRQGRYGADAVRTQFAVIREYAGYAQRARVDRTALRTFSEELDEIEYTDNFANLNPDRLHTGRGQFVRFVDLGRLAVTKDVSQFPFSPLRGYGEGARDACDAYVPIRPRAEVAERIAEVLSSTRLWQARQLTPVAITDQEKRYGFWSERLKEIEKHQTAGPVKAVVQSALTGLGAARG